MAKYQVLGRLDWTDVESQFDQREFTDDIVSADSPEAAKITVSAYRLSSVETSPYLGRPTFLIESVVEVE